MPSTKRAVVPVAIAALILFILFRLNFLGRIGNNALIGLVVAAVLFIVVALMKDSPPGI